MRPPRDDYDGAWWHLTNRGIAKRPVFETVRDVQRFLQAISQVVALGLLEVHAYSILTTHFHVLARSVMGEVSEGVRRIVNPFVRWFNRSRQRDGPLFRGRFMGRRIDDWCHWEAVVRYIDLNPVRAGMCSVPSDHPFGSARVYRFGGPPEWLERTEVLRALEGFCAPQAHDASRYDEFATACDIEANAHLVERLLHRRSARSPAFTDLVRAASTRQQSWMRWKATLADGTTPGTAFVSPAEAGRAAEAAARILRRTVVPERADRARDLHVALLHHTAGLSMQEAADRIGVSRTAVHAALRRHASRIADNPAYDQLVARVVRTAVRRSIPLPSHPLAISTRLHTGPDSLVLASATRSGTSVRDNATNGS